MKFNPLKNYLSIDEAKEIRKKLLIIALPAIGENILQMLLQVADTAFLGHYDWRLISGVGAANQIVFIFQAVLIAISIGSMVFISNSIGTKNKSLTKEIAWLSIYLSAFSAIILTSVVLLSNNLIIWFFPGAEEYVQESAQEYLTIILAGISGLSFMVIISATLRGAGDTKSPMLMALIANAINIFLDYVLIYGKLGFPEMGVKGAAYATVFSRIVGSVILIILLFKNKKISLNLKPIKSSWKRIKSLLSVGLPIAIERLSFSVGVLVFANILLYAGAKAYAAHRIGIRVESIAFMPELGLMVAVTALVGNYNGKGLINKVIGTLRQGWIIGIIMGAIMGAVFFIFPEALIRIFTDELEIIQIASLPVKIIGLFQIVQAIDFVASGALRGVGDTRFPMLSSMLAMWLIRIPIGFALVRFFGMGLLGAWIGMMGDMVFRSMLKVFRILRGRWEKTAEKIRAEAS